MPSSFLLEIGFWGLPYFSLNKEVFRDLPEIVSRVVQQERFSLSRVRVWFSAFRLAFLLEGVSDQQTDLLTEVRGPKSANTFDFSGLPTQVATGFAKNQGVDVKDLAIREIDGERFLFARRLQKGYKFVEMVNGLSCKLVASIPWSASAWFSGMILPHPPLNICAMLNENPVSVTIDNMVSNNNIIVFEDGVCKNFPIPHAQEYPRIQTDHGISATPADRQKLIESALQQVSGPGLTIRKDSQILERLSFEVERPKPLVLSLSQECIKLPLPIFSRVLREYPGFLPFETIRGELQAKVITFTNQSSHSAPELEFRVAGLCQKFELVHRLLAIDLAIPIEKRFENLQFIPARNGFDTLFDEAQRVARFAKRIATEANISGSIELVERSVKLLFSERGTATVQKYPELEKCVLFLLAENQKIEKEVIDILREAELADPGKDALPSTPGGAALVLSLLLEELLSANNLSERRRQAISGRFLQILIGCDLHLNIESINVGLSPNRLFVRKFWSDALIQQLSRDGLEKSNVEWLFSTQEIDLAGVAKAAKAWFSQLPQGFDSLVSLKARLLSRFPNLKLNNVESNEPLSAKQLETSLSEKLKALEEYNGCDPISIFEKLEACRAEIEACLMDLPPIFDENNSNYASKTVLLKRATVQIARLPTRAIPGEKQDREIPEIPVIPAPL